MLLTNIGHTILLEFFRDNSFSRKVIHYIFPRASGVTTFLTWLANTLTEDGNKIAYVGSHFHGLKLFDPRVKVLSQKNGFENHFIIFRDMYDYVLIDTVNCEFEIDDIARSVKKKVLWIDTV
jgi:hypothetical protein